MFKEYLDKFKSGTKTMFKEFFNKETNKKQRANMWSFMRLIIPIITLILSIISIITNTMPLLIASCLIAGFGAITDHFDGKSARKYKSESEYGKVLDQVTDKYYAGVIGINLSLLNPLYLIVLLGEAIIGAVNVSYKLKYKDMEGKSSIVGKFKQWPLYITLALGYLSTINSVLLSIANISVIITFLVQILTAITYIKQNSEEVKKLKNNINEKTILTEVEDENKRSKELVLEKTNSNNTVNNTMSRKEQYQKLRDVLNQVLIKESKLHNKSKTLVLKKENDK